MPSVTVTRERRRAQTRTPAASAAIVLVIASGCDEAAIREERLPKGVESTHTAIESADASPSAAADDNQQDPAAWTVPAGWTLDPEPRPMRVATFSVRVNESPVEVAVTRFEGDVGGILANVNRWRGQMGLPHVDEGGLEATISRFGSTDWPGYSLRIAGTDQHMLAAGVFERAANRTWFARVTATPAEIDLLEHDFEAFVHSIGQHGLP